MVLVDCRMVMASAALVMRAWSAAVRPVVPMTMAILRSTHWGTRARVAAGVVKSISTSGLPASVEVMATPGAGGGGDFAGVFAEEGAGGGVDGGGEFEHGGLFGGEGNEAFAHAAGGAGDGERNGGHGEPSLKRTKLHCTAGVVGHANSRISVRARPKTLAESPRYCGDIPTHAGGTAVILRRGL